LLRLLGLATLQPRCRAFAPGCITRMSAASFALTMSGLPMSTMRFPSSAHGVRPSALVFVVSLASPLLSLACLSSIMCCDTRRIGGPKLLLPASFLTTTVEPMYSTLLLQIM
jgi:hypothetical protein